MSEEKANALGLTPRARFHAFAVAGSDPDHHAHRADPATKSVLEKAKLTLDDIDVIEINEAFASVVAGLGEGVRRRPEQGQRERWGHRPRPSARCLGRQAHGHPAQRAGADTRVATASSTMCEGGGMANATIIERLG